MIALLLTLLMAQGIPTLPGESGAVSGIVRTSEGTPAAGVRVSAMVPPEANTDAASAASFAALAQTDEQGRYRLEGIPVGRYYIVAGRVDLPTYFPGTPDMANARVFSIAPGGAVSGIDFVVMDTSIRTAQSSDAFGLGRPVTTIIPLATQVNVVVEGGAKLPVFSSGGFTALRLTNPASSNPRTQPLYSSFSINLDIAPEYRVSVLNLPEGYVVKSIMFGSTDAMSAPLRIPSALLPRPIIRTVDGVTQTVLMSVPAAGQTVPELNITLATVPVPATPGVRVRGQVKNVEDRGIYLSGAPGTLYSDGSFEFRGVMPGRHSIATVGTTTQSSSGVSIVVGERDVEDVSLEPIAVLPRDVKSPTAPGPAGDYAQGTVLVPASLKGRVIEEASGKPIEEGTVKLIGRDSAVAPIGPGGEFEFSRLLPGSYDLEVQIFGHANVRQSIVMGDQAIRVDVKTLRLY